MSKRKNAVELSLIKKKEILSELSTSSVRKLAEKYGVSKSTISNIKNKKEDILNAMDSNTDVERKRKIRKTDFHAVNVSVKSFFDKCRSKNIPISGPILQEKAKKLATELNVDIFKASNGWLESFRKRHNIQFKTLCGEGVDVNFKAVSDRKENLPRLLKDYSPENQFNADETGVFYRQLPTRSLVTKGSCCKGGKLAKERLSVLFCCSSTGEKLMPLVIGNAAQPRAFRQNKIDTKNFILQWAYNKKAWMTSVIFEEWLDSINKQMKLQKRKIILLIDNATSHKLKKDYSNVLVKFLPPNLTSEIQPLDQRIIQNVKVRYRSKMMLSLITHLDECKTSSELSRKLTVLDAIRWLVSAWDEVKPDVIAKFFCRAGFPCADLQNEPDENLNFESELIQMFPEEIQTELVMPEDNHNMENTIDIHEIIADSHDEVLKSVMEELNPTSQEVSSDESEDDSDNNYELPTSKQALSLFDELILYVSVKQQNLLPEFLNLKSKFEKGISLNILKQSNLNSFLS